MLQRLKTVIPFVATLYFAAACLLSLYLPWYEESRGPEGRIFDGYSWLWKRQDFQAHLDWAALAGGHLALLLAFVCFLCFLCCLQIVFTSKVFTSVKVWLRCKLNLPAKIAVPLCIAYLLSAAYLGVRAPTPQVTWDESSPVIPLPKAAPAAPAAAAPTPGPVIEGEGVPIPPQAPASFPSADVEVEPTRASLLSSHIKPLSEVALFVFTVAVYFGLASLFRRRRRPQESGAK